MANRPRRVWRGRRRRLLSQTKKLLERLEQDRDREILKEEAGKTPLYLALPESITWDQVTSLKATLAAALIAVA